MDNLIPLIMNTKEIQKSIADSVKELRLSRELTRKTLAERAGISVHTLKHFEETGNISLKTLLMIAEALGRTEEFTELFKKEEYKSLSDIENDSVNKRQRGRI